MRLTGTYNHDSEYDLDHELNNRVEELENVLKNIETNGNDLNRLRIIQAILERTLKELDEIRLNQRNKTE